MYRPDEIDDIILSLSRDKDASILSMIQSNAVKEKLESTLKQTGESDVTLNTVLLADLKERRKCDLAYFVRVATAIKRHADEAVQFESIIKKYCRGIEKLDYKSPQYEPEYLQFIVLIAKEIQSEQVSNPIEVSSDLADISIEDARLIWKSLNKTIGNYYMEWYADKLGFIKALGDLANDPLFSNMHPEFEIPQHNIWELLRDSIDDIPQNRQKILLELHNGRVLEDIAADENVTRQWVANKVSLACEKIKPIHNQVIKHMTLTLSGFTDKNIPDWMLQSDEWKIYNEMLKRHLLTRIQGVNGKPIYVPDEYASKISPIIDDIRCRIDKVEWLPDFRRWLQEYLESNGLSDRITADDAIDSLRDYCVVSDYLIMPKLSSNREAVGASQYLNARMELVKHLYPNGITFSTATITNLENLTGNCCNMQKENAPIRSTWNSITKRCILCGQSTYTHPDNVKVSKKLVDTIYEYIKQRQGVKLPYSEIYTGLKDILAENNIENKDLLHGIISYYLGDKVVACARSCYIPVRGQVKHLAQVMSERSEQEARVVYLDEFNEYISPSGYSSFFASPEFNQYLTRVSSRCVKSNRI